MKTLLLAALAVASFAFSGCVDYGHREPEHRFDPRLEHHDGR